MKKSHPLTVCYSPQCVPMPHPLANQSMCLSGPLNGLQLRRGFEPSALAAFTLGRLIENDADLSAQLIHQLMLEGLPPETFLDTVVGASNPDSVAGSLIWQLHADPRPQGFSFYIRVASICLAPTLEEEDAFECLAEGLVTQVQTAVTEFLKTVDRSNRPGVDVYLLSVPDHDPVTRHLLEVMGRKRMVPPIL